MKIKTKSIILFFSRLSSVYDLTRCFRLISSHSSTSSLEIYEEILSKDDYSVQSTSYKNHASLLLAPNVTHKKQLLHQTSTHPEHHSEYPQKYISDKVTQSFPSI